MVLIPLGRQFEYPGPHLTDHCDRPLAAFGIGLRIQDLHVGLERSLGINGDLPLVRQPDGEVRAAAARFQSRLLVEIDMFGYTRQFDDAPQLLACSAGVTTTR